MKKTFYLLFVLINLINRSAAQGTKRLANINSIFDKMELQGVDTKKPLLYGYFFYDKDQSKLENLQAELLRENYRSVRLEMTKKQEFILHVEKEEIHSRTSLLERETQLDYLSKKFKIATYDGWDVGNADPAKPLISKNSFEKSLDTKTDAALYKFAAELYDSDTNDKAIIAFNKCIERNIKVDTCNYKLGVSYLGVGQTEMGIAKLEQAVKLNPEYFKACFNLGATYYDNKQYQKSIGYYQKAAKINSKDDKVFYGIAASQFVLGQFNDAETNCKTALKLNPNNNNASSLLDNIKKKQ